jgi:hypothetical protein
LQFQHDQRGSQVLLPKKDDIGLDPIQQGEVSFKQCASLKRKKEKAYVSIRHLPT